MTNSQLSERVAMLARIAPQTISANSATSAYIAPATLGKFGRILAIAQTGENSTGDVTVSLIKASDGSGTGAEVIRSASVLSSGDGDNKDILLNFHVDETDPDKPYVALRITVSASTCVASGCVLAGDARFAPADAHNAASVAQIVG